jgi:hypothetical protein
LPDSLCFTSGAVPSQMPVEHKLKLRVAGHGGAFYYDLADRDWRAVEITENGCRIVSPPVPLFMRNKNTKAQVEPDFSGDVRLLENHVRFKSDEDLLLYIVYVVTCLVPGIPHAVLILCGEKGSAKSTAMRFTRSIVDPANSDLLIMPNSSSDLILSLFNNYMPCYDNLAVLSKEKSDILCVASTGGGSTKRTLYSETDETILKFKHCPVLNGINVVATQDDLLDRTILLELERIPDADRREESAVWDAFEADKAKILGGALNVLHRAMGIYRNLTLTNLFRMADFTRWGYAVAEAIDGCGDRFLEAYENNQQRANEEALANHPVATAVITLMKELDEWESTVSELLDELKLTAENEGIPTRSRLWPRAPHVLILLTLPGAVCAVAKRTKAPTKQISLP